VTESQGKRDGHRVAWAIMIGCGATSWLYNVAHALHGTHGTHDLIAAGMAVLYGTAAVYVSVLASHMAVHRRPVWEILAYLGVLLAAMGMSAGATAAVVRPVAGPVLCWVFPATLDTATLMAFRFIVVPEPAGRGKRWWTKTAGGKPATKPAGGRGTKPPKDPGLDEAKTDQAPDELAGAKSQRDLMREAWDAAIAAGKIPTGGDLNRAIGRPGTYSLGKKWAARWRAELPPEKAAALTAGSRP